MRSVILFVTKLLIIHADDLGMAHSVNAASIKALENGAITSASIMVPCPWFSEIAAWARAHQDADLGLHLTLTSEWETLRWRPLTNGATLRDKDGFFHLTEDVAAKNIDPREAEAEIRAQIDRAIAAGIRPTHLDSHMRTLHQNEALFTVLLKVSRDYKIPVAVDRALAARYPNVLRDDLVIDRFVSIGTDVTDWKKYYTDVIRNLEPGVTELIVHLAYDDAEMRAATVNHPGWGAAWRQRDFDVLMSEEFRRLLRENGVKLTTWREVAAKGGAAVAADEGASPTERSAALVTLTRR